VLNIGLVTNLLIIRYKPLKFTPFNLFNYFKFKYICSSALEKIFKQRRKINQDVIAEEKTSYSNSGFTRASAEFGKESRHKGSIGCYS
jgi:hypothetical protein